MFRDKWFIVKLPFRVGSKISYNHNRYGNEILYIHKIDQMKRKVYYNKKDFDFICNIIEGLDKGIHRILEY